MCPDEALCFPDGFCHRAGDPPACEVDAFGAADAPLQPDAGIDAEPPDAAPPDTSPPDGASCGELGCQQSLGETCASCPLDCGFCVEDGPSIPDGPPLG
jgi:hypothetical protein